ncbi:MAG: hypothetical protein LBB74_03985 [Chitinispirillales bacterium]|jgi:hypothetical protein|nr:hypothetical protein [Chitinispirillales bacterium]
MKALEPDVFDRVAGGDGEGKKDLHSGAESGILDKGAKDNMLNMADTGGRRNEKPLTDEQLNQAKEYAVSLGMPAERIEYDERALTGYFGGDIDALVIGTDVVPLSQRSKKPNDNLSLRGAIAHEIVGHRGASLLGKAQSNIVLEEAQASIRAARFTPDLSDGERLDLIKDAISRLHNADISLHDVKSALFINRR